MAGKIKLSREAAVQLCEDLLYSGKSRKEILQEISEKYKASEKTVDNWLKAARPRVKERQEAAKENQEAIDKEAADTSARRLNLTREAMLERLGEVIYYGKEQPKETEPKEKAEGSADDDQPTAIIIVKAYDVIRAIEVVNKMQGYNAPEKSELDLKNLPQPVHTTLIIKPRSDRKRIAD